MYPRQNCQKTKNLSKSDLDKSGDSTEELRQNRETSLSVEMSRSSAIVQMSPKRYDKFIFHCKIQVIFSTSSQFPIDYPKLISSWHSSPVCLRAGQTWASILFTIVTVLLVSGVNAPVNCDNNLSCRTLCFVFSSNLKSIEFENEVKMSWEKICVYFLSCPIQVKVYKNLSPHFIYISLGFLAMCSGIYLGLFTTGIKTSSLREVGKSSLGTWRIGFSDDIPDNSVAMKIFSKILGRGLYRIYYWSRICINCPLHSAWILNKLANPRL